MVNFVPAVAYHFCLNLPAAFSQPGARLILEPCTSISESPEDVEEAIKSALESGKMDPSALKRLLEGSGLSDLADLAKSLVVAAALGDR